MRYWFLIITVIVVLTNGPIQNVNAQSDAKSSAEGLDFVCLHCALNAVEKGKNPYDMQELNEICSESFGTEFLPRPVRFMYPPWFLAIIYPIVKLPFVISFLAWPLLNAMAALAACIIYWKTISDKTPRLYLIFIIIASFPPFYDLLQWGQNGSIALFGLVATFYFLKQKKDLTAALLLMLAILKPHIIYLLIVPFVWWVIREKRFKFAVMAGLSFCGLLACSEVLVPGIVRNWATAGYSSFSHAFQAENPSIIDVAQYYLFNLSGTKQVWPMYIIPVLSLAITILYFVIYKPKTTLVFMCLPLLPISLLTTPYCWFHDFIITLPLLIDVLVKNTSKNQFALLIIISYQSAQFFLTSIAHHHHWFFFYYPLGILLIWCLCRPKVGLGLD